MGYVELEESSDICVCWSRREVKGAESQCYSTAETEHWKEVLREWLVWNQRKPKTDPQGTSAIKERVDRKEETEKMYMEN